MLLGKTVPMAPGQVPLLKFGAFIVGSPGAHSSLNFVRNDRLFQLLRAIEKKVHFLLVRRDAIFLLLPKERIALSCFSFTRTHHWNNTRFQLK